MITDDFSELLQDSVTIEPFTSEDDYGARSYGAGIAYPCRISGAQKIFVDVTGLQRVSQAIIYLTPMPVFGPKDRLTLPATFSPMQPPIARIDQVSDEQGPHHQKIYV